MAHVIQHTQCPICAKHGRDRNGDNLCLYSDGSMYCFSCHYWKAGNGLSRIKDTTVVDDTAIVLPSDADTVLPRVAREYLGRYGITRSDVTLNTVMWSDYWQRLIFPYFNDKGIVAWQGRYLGTEKGKAKWYSKGNLKEFQHFVGNKHSQTFVLTEDIISAIKVSHNTQVCAVPLFGSHVSTKRLLQLKRNRDTLLVYVWLDKDKQKESMQYAKVARDFGINCRSIITDLDPKEYSDPEIMELIQ